MRAVDLATVLIRVAGVVSLVFGAMSLALLLVAMFILGGPLKTYEPLTTGVISGLAGWTILYLVFGCCLILPSHRLARFAAKLPNASIKVPEV